jgi:hypothetical protein
MERMVKFSESELINIKILDIKPFEKTDIYPLLEKRLSLCKMYNSLDNETKNICISEIHLLNEIIRMYLGI